MASKHCQAGKGHLKRTLLLQTGSNWDEWQESHQDSATSTWAMSLKEKDFIAEA
jgi:hypothetical protein